MYLAHVQRGQTRHYIIRKSRYDEKGDNYSFSDIFDLGEDPDAYITTMGDGVSCFDERLEDAVGQECGGDPTSLLEDLLWWFLSPEERGRIAHFRRPGNIRLRPLSDEERLEIEKYVHMFDRRRMYYIRYGAVDQSRIYRLSDKLYRPLLFKCRDEKEFYFRSSENSLSPAEFKNYLYVIFDLQKHFDESYAAFLPEALREEVVEDMFLEEICRLNDDAGFWRDDGTGESFLRPHLQMYLARFFDLDFRRRSFQHDYVRAFQEKHRRVRWPERKAKVSEEAALDIFGEKLSVLKAMGKAELARLFRKRAKEFHPDSGGESAKFIALIEAYESLRRV